MLGNSTIVTICNGTQQTVKWSMSCHRSLLPQLIAHSVKVNHDGVLPPSPPTLQGLTVLLHGPPGTGKTLAAEAVGYEVGRPLKVRGVAVGGQGSEWVVVWAGLRVGCGVGGAQSGLWCGWGSEWVVVWVGLRVGCGVGGAQSGLWCGWGSEWGMVVGGAQNGVWLWVGLRMGCGCGWGSDLGVVA